MALPFGVMIAKLKRAQLMQDVMQVSLLTVGTVCASAATFTGYIYNLL